MSIKNFDALRLAQVDAVLARWRDAHLPAPPPQGWTATIRQALGMSATALAARLGMTPPGLRKLEKAEADRTITLASLQKLAEALNCDLRYALVPRQPLGQWREQRANEVVAAELRPVEHSMALEDQAVRETSRQRQVNAMIHQLLARKSGRGLW